MSSDHIIRGKDNKIRVSINIEGEGVSDLQFFDYVLVEYGADSWRTDNDPTIVYFEQDGNDGFTILVINAGQTTETEARYFTITGYQSAVYPNGFQFTSKCMDNLALPKIC